MKITAVLMASGYSRRFTEDKLMLSYKGTSLLAHTMAVIKSCSFSDYFLIQREGAYNTLAKANGFTSIDNPFAAEGQAASIRLGVKNSPAGSAFMFFTGDQPLLSGAVIQKLLCAYQEHPDSIIVPRVNGNNKSPTIFPAAFANDLLRINGDIGGRFIIRQHPDRIVFVPFPEELPFQDIDTPEDYQRLLLL